MNFSKIEFVRSYGTGAQLPPSSLPEIAFAGHSNVGKSTLINRLFNRKNLARTSSQPGKTITVNFYRTDGAFIVDLPGYGYARRSAAEKERWAELMESYYTTNRDIALTVQLVDGTHAPTADDLGMLDFLCSAGMPFVIVRTKCDKLNVTDAAKRRAESEKELAPYAGATVIECPGAGLETLKRSMEAAL